MPWPQNAYVGQKVVCIHADNQADKACGLFVSKVYTIRALELHPGDGKLCFHLAECSAGSLWIGWYASRFRPVQSTETGMAILRGLLKPTKLREDA